MRIAVIQLEIQPEQRTATFQRALRATDAACEADPAPDLVLLPAFVDAPAVASGRAAACEKLHGQTTAALGLRARNWGVFIALGLAEEGPDKPYVTSVLIDRDGDLRHAHRQVSFEVSNTSVFGAGNRFATTSILLGKIALLTGDDLFNPQAWDAVVKSEAQIVLGTACWSRRESDNDAILQIRSHIAEQAARCGRWCAVADVTTGPGRGDDYSCPGLSAVFNGEGEIVVAAEPDVGTTLWSDVMLPDLSTAVED